MLTEAVAGPQAQATERSGKKLEVRQVLFPTRWRHFGSREPGVEDEGEEGPEGSEASLPQISSGRARP